VNARNSVHKPFAPTECAEKGFETVNFCPTCGSRLSEQARFCVRCGTSVSDASPPVPPVHPAPSDPTPFAPTAQYPPTTSASQVQASVTGPGYSPPVTYAGSPAAAFRHSSRLGPVSQAFLTGDWRGAGVAVAAGIATMLGLALVSGLLADMSTGTVGGQQILGGVATLVALAAGGTLTATSGSLVEEGDIGPAAEVSIRPLGLTLVGFSVLAVLFARRLRRRGPLTATEVALQAGRVGVVMLGALFVVALLSRVRSSSGVTTRVDVISTMFFGLLTLSIALAVATILMLPNVWPPRVEHYRALLFGPVRAVLVLMTLTGTVALVGILIWMISWSSSVGDTGTGPFWRTMIASILLLLPNLAAAGLLFGMGVPATGTIGGTFGIYGESADASMSILDLIDRDQRFWIWPVATAVLLAITGVSAARRSPARPNGRPAAHWLAVVLPVALFVLALSLSADGSGAAAGFGLGGSAGFDYLLTLVVGAVYGLLAGLFGAALTRRRPYAGIGPLPTAPAMRPSAPPLSPPGPWTYAPSQPGPAPTSPAGRPPTSNDAWTVADQAPGYPVPFEPTATEPTAHRPPPEGAVPPFGGAPPPPTTSDRLHPHRRADET
jgi:hypothetical protein